MMKWLEFTAVFKLLHNSFINPALLGLSTQIRVDKPSFCEGLYFQK